MVFLGAADSLLKQPALQANVGMAPTTLVMGVLLVNFGESIFFALGASGLLVWLLIGAAQVMGGGVQQWRR